ncbi:invasion associated locus B family protein [Pseudovibrio exalbescens]|nr:invasion associated locus B family protein [Pseudovibrio exalbescens]MDD7909389.1 invasion associated locus B family protein [Pseudovibrio exalbescens]
MALGISGAAAHAQSANLVKQNRDWGAYTFSGQNGKICYAVSKPTQLLPTDRNHGDVFFFVSTRPNEQVNNEPSVIVGYNFREGSTVTANVDGTTFTMFTKGDGAWVQNAAEEQRLINAMKAGREMTISGVSGRGTQTTYKFSLSGITASINDANAACR